MAHIRLRKFNTKEMYPDQKLDNDLWHGGSRGQPRLSPGQTGMDFDGKVAGIGDPAAQTETA